MRLRVLAILLIAGATSAPAPAADMGKTLHVAFPAAENGFDPQVVYDTYSFDVCRAIFEPLYTFDYFARPVRLVPNTAESLPVMTDGGRTYTIKVKRGIFFAADPAFKGKPRELTAEDYVFSIKRMIDPKVRSYWLYLLEKNLVGLDPVLARARETGTLDYDTPIEGLKAIDRYTLQIRFNRPDYAFQSWLAAGQFGAVAREVVDAYKDASNRVMENPVGTGPYMLKQWTRGQKIVLEANPAFREMRYPAPGPGSEPGDAAIAGGLVGKRLPLVGNIDIRVIEEPQPRLLSFISGALDYFNVPPTLAENILAGAVLKPEFAKRNMVLHRQISPSISFFYFNLEDPLVGGYAQEKLALRRAISMGYDRKARIVQVLNGQAIPATQPVPPPLYGHDPKYMARYGFDPAAARTLLDRFGFKDRDGDGYRELPDGKPLTLVIGSTPDAASRVSDELWKRSMDAIGIRVEFLKNKWPELNKMSEAGQLMLWGFGWTSSIPDGRDYYSYFYSRNIGTSNDARMRLPLMDTLFEEALALPDGPKRTALFDRMNDLVYDYAPWILTDYPYLNVVAQPWLRGYKQNPFIPQQWWYYDVAPH